MPGLPAKVGRDLYTHLNKTGDEPSVPRATPAWRRRRSPEPSPSSRPRDHPGLLRRRASRRRCTSSRTPATSASTTCRPEMIRSLADLFTPRGLEGRAGGGRLRPARRRVLRAPRRGARRAPRGRARAPRAVPRAPTSRRCSPATRRPAGATRSRRRAASSTASARERELLAPIRERADVVIDTTGLSRRRAARARSPTSCSSAEAAGQARGHLRVLRVQARPAARRRPRLRRPLPAQPALRARPAAAAPASTGGSSSTSAATAAWRSSTTALLPLLEYLLPQYVARGQVAPVVAIGCTGGRHRSVAIAEHLAAHFTGRERATSSRSSTATSTGAVRRAASGSAVRRLLARAP